MVEPTPRPPPDASPDGEEAQKQPAKTKISVMDAQTFASLPFVRALWPRDPSVPGDNKVVEALVEEFYVCQEVDKLKNSPIPKELAARQEIAVERANQSVSRRFRRATLQVHPDHYGDLFEREFNQLVAAATVLSNPEQRQSYVSGLVTILRNPALLGITTVEQAHKNWVQYQEEGEQMNTDRARYEQKMKQQQGGASSKPLSIEAGILSKQPKRIQRHRIVALTRTVEAVVPILEPFPSYRASCRSIVIQLTSTNQDVQTKQVEIKGAELEQLFKHYETYHVMPKSIVLPDWGNWQVQWYAVLSLEGTESQGEDKLKQTPPSVEVTWEVPHPHYATKVGELAALKVLCKQKSGRLQSELTRLKHKKHGSQQQQNMEQDFWSLHSCIAQARHAASRLQSNLEWLEMNLDGSEELKTIRQALFDAQLFKSELDSRKAFREKKGSLRAFKQSLAGTIESGSMAEWILNVTREDISNTGGETNRLYQLLIEGKKANSLMLDSAALMNAAQRTDLFSKKQCDSLSQRATEVEALHQQETEKLIKATEDEKVQETSRREMEERSRQIGLLRGEYVKIEGLRSRLDLNGTIGVFMGVAPNNRFHIRSLWGEQKEYALLKENFVKYSQYEAAKPPSMDGTLSPGPTPTASAVLEHNQKPAAKVPLPSPAAAKLSPTKEAPTTLPASGAKPPPQSAKSKPDATPPTTSGPKPAVKSAPKSPNATPPPASVPKPVAKSAPKPAPPAAPIGQASAEPQTAKTASASKHTTILVVVQKKHVAALIGPRGSKVKRMIADSGASRIHVEKGVDKEGNCKVRVEGSYSSVEKARHMIYQFNLEKSGGKKPAPMTPGRPPAVISEPATPPAALSHNATAESVAALEPGEQGEVANEAAEEEVASPPESPRRRQRGAGSSKLLNFLHTQKSCLRIPKTPNDLYEWLKEQDVDSLETLLDAVQDDDFLTELQTQGLKGYKKAAFKKAIAVALHESAVGVNLSNLEAKYRAELAKFLQDMRLSRTEFDAIDNHAPNHLQCSISTVLMVVDPVLAADGHTYERVEIAKWIEQKRTNNKTVTSPKTNEDLDHLSLTPNIAIRTMAREFVVEHKTSNKGK